MPTTEPKVPPGFPELGESLTRARMDIAELKGMVKMHFGDSKHHTPPCATAQGALYGNGRGNPFAPLRRRLPRHASDRKRIKEVESE